MDRAEDLLIEAYNDDGVRGGRTAPFYDGGAEPDGYYEDFTQSLAEFVKKHPRVGGRGLDWNAVIVDADFGADPDLEFTSESESESEFSERDELDLHDYTEPTAGSAEPLSAYVVEAGAECALDEYVVKADAAGAECALDDYVVEAGAECALDEYVVKAGTECALDDYVVKAGAEAAMFCCDDYVVGVESHDGYDTADSDAEDTYRA